MCKSDKKQRTSTSSTTTTSAKNVSINSRKLPFLSECMLFPLTCLAAFLHLTTRPLGIEPAVSMLITSGFFGIVLIPIGFACLVVELVDKFIYNGIATLALHYVGIPFVVAYIVMILIVDKTHCCVKNANSHTARNKLEVWSTAFFLACHDYCPFTCEVDRTVTLDPNQQYIFAVHPHGIHCLPLMMLSQKGSVFDRQYPNLVGSQLTGLCATVMFKLPLDRELFLCMGYIDASRSIASKALKEGRSLFVCTGGEEEAMLTEMGKDVVVLQKRKGFIRLALSHGASLVPVYGVGNSDLFTTYQFLGRQRRWLQKTCAIALPIFHGRWLTPLPYKTPMKVVVGKPIPTPKPAVIGAKPEDALVEEYHAKYIEALKELHAKHVSDRKLSIQ